VRFDQSAPGVPFDGEVPVSPPSGWVSMAESPSAPARYASQRPPAPASRSATIPPAAPPCWQLPRV